MYWVNYMSDKTVIIEKKTFDGERALYALGSAVVRDCTFAGPSDGESALKESRDVLVENCRFSLRYPLWHSVDYELVSSVLDEKTRAPIWYSRKGKLSGCEITGVKCLRECDDTFLKDCRISSPEVGWRCREVNIESCDITSEYLLFEASNVRADGLAMHGKYSFQYVEDSVIENSVLDTKDAFWHSRNVTVRNSVIKGEYLGWYSENLTLENCRIIGTQPLCYCKGLRLIGCTMENTDLAFEYSEVDADIIGDIMSVKNPHIGKIVADSFGEIILEDSVMENECEIKVRQKS